MKKRTDEEKKALEAEVRAIAASIRDRGEAVSAMKVREEIKKLRPKPGDQKVIDKYYREWRDGPDASQAGSRREIPPALLEVLRIHLDACARDAKAELTAQLDGMLIDEQDLVARNAELADKIVDLQTALAAHASERDTAVGALAECRSHLDDTQTALRASDGRLEAATKELAAATAQVTVLQADCLALKEECRAASNTADQLRAQLASAVALAKSETERALRAEGAAELLKAPAARRSIRPARPFQGKGFSRGRVG
jgi:hypothetical protein